MNEGYMMYIRYSLSLERVRDEICHSSPKNSQVSIGISYYRRTINEPSEGFQGQWKLFLIGSHTKFGYV